MADLRLVIGNTMMVSFAELTQAARPGRIKALLALGEADAQAKRGGFLHQFGDAVDEAEGGNAAAEVTRWREDSTCDNWGTFCYIRDVASGDFWSTAHQPTRARPARYEAIFTEARAEFRRRDDDFELAETARCWMKAYGLSEREAQVAPQPQDARVHESRR